VRSHTGVVDLREALQAEMRETPKGTVWQEDAMNKQDNNDILGRDPTGPLAPLGGLNLLLQHKYNWFQSKHAVWMHYHSFQP
jgi:hypothetical protein